MVMALTWSLETRRPWMGVLALCLLLVLYFHRRSLVDFPRPQRIASLVLRGTLLVLLVLAAAGLNFVGDDDRQFVVLLIDCSDSVADEAIEHARRFARRAAETLRPGDQSRVIEFAADVSRPRAPQDETNALDELDRSRTDLAGALAVGWASIPAFYAKTLVVLSDGRSTEKDPAPVLRQSTDAGVRVHTVPLETRTKDEVQLTHVKAPAQVRTGAPFDLAVEVTANHEDAGVLEVYRNDIRVKTEKVVLKAGANRFRFRQVASTDRFQAYDVRIQAERDRFVDNNRASALVTCEGKPRVLVVEDTPRDARYLTWALEKEDIVVDVRGPRGVPRTLADIENFELVCLSDIAATELDKRQMQLIRSYVQELGGGFIMIGGEQSFGLGGYYKTALEEILPVRSDFEKEKEKPSLGMVLVIDKSGSMGGMKIELAKEAAKSAVELLGRRDQVGVIAFDGSAKWICDVHPASDGGYIMERIGSLVAGGGTNLAPALSEAYTALEGTTAKLKHVIALTDGHSQPDNFYEIVSSMANSSITVSTVAVGSGADRPLLERIANWGGGRTYFTENAAHIPQIFAKETMEASKSAINERPFTPVQVRPHQICQGIDLGQVPFLLGYVITTPKPTAELVLATEAGHPLLATWRYGLGKSLAFTSDAKNRWASEWLQWEGFSRFWSQVVRDTMRSSSHASMHVAMRRAAGRMEVVVDALHPSADRMGEYLDGAETTLELIRPGEGTQTLSLEQAQPGRYAGSFEVDDNRSYHVRIAQRKGDVQLQSVTRGVVAGYSDEYRVGSTDHAVLKRLARVGGGSYDVAPDALLDAESKAIRVRPLWPILVAAAIALLILDVALRRVDLSIVLGRSRTWQEAVSST